MRRLAAAFQNGQPQTNKFLVRGTARAQPIALRRVTSIRKAVQSHLEKRRLAATFQNGWPRTSKFPVRGKTRAQPIALRRVTSIRKAVQPFRKAAASRRTPRSPCVASRWVNPVRRPTTSERPSLARASGRRDIVSIATIAKAIEHAAIDRITEHSHRTIPQAKVRAARMGRTETPADVDGPTR